MPITREELETQEAARLAPNGMPSRDSRGRKYPDPEHPYRVICDYIAGMTDRFALQEHQRLFDPGTQV